MASKNKQVLQSNTEEWRNFKYSHGNVNMDMKLRVDIKDHLNSALIICEQYVQDLKRALEKLGDKKR